MRTILLYILLVVISVIYFAACLVQWTVPLAFGSLSTVPPAIIAIVVVGALLMVMTQPPRMMLPVARVIRRLAKGVPV